MAARGPDGAGLWSTPDWRLALGHRRLSIIDLSDAAAQPMTSADTRFVVTFNGEIYNYRQLRANLEAAGQRFRSKSDTEVLLHLYERHGIEMIHQLRGMFAFAIWDNRDRTLFLARDPYGIKPLYYADDGCTLRFASQVKALLAGGGISREIDPAGQVGFYLWGSVPEPFTMFAGIKALPAGHTMMVRTSGSGEPAAYHSIASVYAASLGAKDKQQCETEMRANVHAALLDSVRHHLVSDVPVGAFLSAGIDSCALVGLMRDAGAGDIQTVTLTFEEFRRLPDDEAPLAETVARRYGTRHTARGVGAKEFRDDLPAIFAAMDQPSIDGINTWFVSKAAHELGLKVAISGLGGDELFGGYPSFRDIPRWIRCFSPATVVPLLGRSLRMLGQAAGIDRAGVNPKALGLLEYGGDFAGAYLLRRGIYMPWELDGILGAQRVREGWAHLAPLKRTRAVLSPHPGSAFNCVATLESSLYMRNQLLRDSDWASMAHGVEIRVPLVDSFLLKEVAAVTSLGMKRSAKSWLAASPRLPLPDTIINRRKTGFGIPVGRWSGLGVKNAAQPASGYARDWARMVADQAVSSTAQPAIAA